MNEFEQRRIVEEDEIFAKERMKEYLKYDKLRQQLEEGIVKETREYAVRVANELHRKKQVSFVDLCCLNNNKII